MHGVTWTPTRWHGRTTARPGLGVRRDVRVTPLRGFAAGGAAPLGGSSSDDEGAAPDAAAPDAPAGFSLPGWASPARNWPLFLRTFAVSVAHVAARALSQPLAPALDRLQARAEASPAVRAACAALRVDDLAALRDVCNAVVLSECVYKAVGRPEGDAVAAMAALKAAFPPALVSLSAVQFARPHVRHRFAVAESEDAVYVALMGTKLPRDFLANAAVWQEEVALDASMLSTDDAEGVGPGGEGGPAPAAHRGFLARARGIPIDALFAQARRRGKRLVFTGHSLGGAVAALCAMRLLQRLPPELHGEVAAVGFATPPLGNEALAALVEERGWGRRIRNYLVPEDPIPGLLSAPAQREAAGGGGDAGAAQGGPPAAVPLSSASAAVLHAVDAEEETEEQAAAVLTLISADDTGGSGDGARRGFGPAALGRSLGRGTLRAMGAVGAVAGPPARAASNILLAPLAAPLRAARPKYQPLGQQLYLCEDAVRGDKPAADAPPPQRRRLSGAAAPAPPPPPEDAEAPPAGWWPGLTRSLSVPSLSALFPHSAAAAAAAAEGDDDNVDVAAAAAAAGALVPDRLPARTLFPMHRMLTYRTRLLGLCHEALEGHAWPAAGLRSSGPAGLPLLPTFSAFPAFPNPDGIAHSELLAPAMFPVKAVAAPAAGTAAEPAAAAAAAPPSETPPLAPTASSAVRRRVAWPLSRLLRRPRPADDATPVDVTIRVEGRGLANVTDCWVSGGAVDAATGKAAPVPVAILSQPRAPAPAALAARRRASLLAPLAALASWVAMAVGWVALVARLQPAGSGDFLVARAQLPAGVVRRAARAARDPLAAAVGDGPRLMLHLRSDFEQVALPVALSLAGEEAGDAAAAAAAAAAGRDHSPPAHSEAHRWWGGVERDAHGGVARGLYRKALRPRPPRGGEGEGAAKAAQGPRPAVR